MYVFIQRYTFPTFECMNIKNMHEHYVQRICKSKNHNIFHLQIETEDDKPTLNVWSQSQCPEDYLVHQPLSI